MPLSTPITRADKLAVGSEEELAPVLCLGGRGASPIRIPSAMPVAREKSARAEWRIGKRCATNRG
jgi:hypothetical protein